MSAEFGCPYCGCLDTEDVLEPEGSYQYARRRCAGTLKNGQPCERFIKWLPKPTHAVFHLSMDDWYALEEIVFHSDNPRGRELWALMEDQVERNIVRKREPQR